MVEHESSSAPQPRFASYTYGTTLFRILHVTYAVSCMTFLWVLQVTLTAPCSTIITTLLEVFLVTFVASCCTVRTTLPDPSCNFYSFVHNLSPGLSFSCHGFVLHYLSKPS